MKSLKFFSIFLLMIFLANIVSAPIDTYQVDNSNTGLLTTEPYGVFDENIDHSYSTANGANFQPLIDDINNDGNYEVVIYSSSQTLIKILNDHAVPIAEYEIGGTAYCQMALTDLDSDGIKEIQYCTNWNISSIEWNTTHWTKIATYPISKGGTVYSGIKCSDTNCYMVFQNNSNRDLIVKYNLSGSFIKRILPGSSTFLPRTGSIPALYDIEALSDNSLELVFICDNDADNKLGICVYDTNSNQLDTYFSSDGILDDLAQTTDKISNPLVYNIDGYGSAEIIYSTGGSTSSFTVNMLTGTGTTKYSPAQSTKITVDAVSDLALSYNPLVVKDTNPGICGLALATSSRVVLCVNYDLTDAGIDNKFTDSSDIAVQRTPMLSIPISTPASGGGNVVNDQLLTAKYLLDENLNFSQTNLTGSDLYFVASSDVNQDGSLDLVFSKSGETIIAYSSYENQQASFVDRTLGLSPYSMPICTGTTVTFSAIECGSEPCHYVDEGFDQERLLSSCGTNLTSYFNGTFVDSHPVLNCFYPSVGNYDFNIYLQDNLHKTDFTEYQSRLINVINGTSGINCNLPASDEQETGEDLGGTVIDSGSVEETTQDMFDTITHGSSFLKIILVLAALLGTVVFLALVAKVQNPFVYVITLIMIMCLLAVIGLLAWSIIMLIGFLICLVAAIAWFAGGLGSKGGQ